MFCTNFHALYEMIPNAPKYYELHQNISLGSHGVDWVRLLKKIQMWHRGTNFCFNVYSMFCNKFHAVTKRSQMHPNTTKPTETLVQGPIGWIRCIGCKKLQRDFMAQTFALIGPVQYVLRQVSCSYETFPNSPNYYIIHRNVSLGSNGVDWVRSLRKIPM